MSKRNAGIHNSNSSFRRGQAEQLREILRDDAIKKRKQQQLEKVLDVCGEIRSLLTQRSYDRWWLSTSDNNFYSEACDKLLALKGYCSDRRAYQDGTEPSPTIQGGVVCYSTIITASDVDVVIPF